MAVIVLPVPTVARPVWVMSRAVSWPRLKVGLPIVTAPPTARLPAIVPPAMRASPDTVMCPVRLPPSWRPMSLQLSELAATPPYAAMLPPTQFKAPRLLASAP